MPREVLKMGTDPEKSRKYVDIWSQRFWKITKASMSVVMLKLCYKLHVQPCLVCLSYYFVCETFLLVDNAGWCDRLNLLSSLMLDFIHKCCQLLLKSFKHTLCICLSRCNVLYVVWLEASQLQWSHIEVVYWLMRWGSARLSKCWLVY